jgi:acetyl-CoA carboxylase carboxyltransferase component
MMEIINRLVDNSEFEPYKDGYGQTIITGYAVDGWAVGIVANQRNSKTKRRRSLVVIYSDSADKATRFIPIAIRKNPFSFLFRMLPVLWWDLNQNKAEL